MLERYGSETDEQANQTDLPESKSFRADNKTFYFDCGSNARGVFLKVSEVRQNRYRTSITVPDKFLKQFRDQINEYVDSVSSLESAGNSAAEAKAPAPTSAPVPNNTSAPAPAPAPTAISTTKNEAGGDTSKPKA
jgi:hypothetical protein